MVTFVGSRICVFHVFGALNLKQEKLCVHSKGNRRVNVTKSQVAIDLCSNPYLICTIPIWFLPIKVKEINSSEMSKLQNIERSTQFEDEVYKDRFNNLVSHPLMLCDLPSVPIWRSFIRTLSDELSGVKGRKWNMENLCVIYSSYWKMTRL